MENKYLYNLKKGRIEKWTLLPVGLLLIFLSACTVTKQSEYFKPLQLGDTTLKGTIPNNYESKIVKGDKLSIMVSGLSPMEDALFNNGGAAAGGSAAGGISTGGYVVDPDGYIYMHRIGKMRVEGFTRRELARQVSEKLTPYIKDPIVQVSYLNHTITVIGEVGKPNILSLPEEQISLLDALVMSGDLTPQAKRTNITIIRDEGNQKKVKHVNMENISIFSSEWYYVKPNDIILVNADLEKTVKDEKRAKLQTSLSLVATVVSLLLVVLSRFIK